MMAYIGGEKMPTVDAVVLRIVRLAEWAVDEERVEGEHPREDEMIEHDAHQVQVLHLRTTHDFCHLIVNNSIMWHKKQA